MSADQNRDEPYNTAIRVLASGARMPPEKAARIERELLQAFAEHHVARVPSATGARRRGRWSPWIAAAAAVAAVSVGLGVWQQIHRVTENNVTTGSVLRPSAPALRPPAEAAPMRSTPATVGRRTGKTSAANRIPSRRPVPRILRPAGFVVIPGTAGLPQFESGTIMRVELPVAALPAYGVDISPAADDHAIEADVLVGQDGQARAIRLVTNTSRSSQ